VLRSAVLGIACVVTPAIGRGATIEVPADQPSIQQAVDAASPGDVIRVAPGTYQESVRIHDEKVGIAIEGVDPTAPPVILGTPNTSADGIRVDGAPGIVLRNLRIVGAYDGVRLNRVQGAVLSGLVIEDNALGIRVNRGSDNIISASTILGTRVEQGILVDGSPGIVLAGNVVDQPDEEGIRILGSPGAVVHDNHVRSSHGGSGITVSQSPGASVIGSSAAASYRNGFRIMNSPGLVLSGNRAESNRNVGFRIEKSPPFTVVADVLAQGNAATGNAGGDIVVEAARCNVTNCTTTTTSTSPTTTSTSTTLPAPLVPARWRFSVRILVEAGGETTVAVPGRSGEAPVEVMIRVASRPTSSGTPSTRFTGLATFMRIRIRQI